MTDFMYSIPDMNDVKKVILTKECVTGEGEPLIEFAKAE